MKMRKRSGRRNPQAQALSSALFRKRVVATTKGRGSYRRQPKHRLAGGDLPADLPGCAIAA